MKLFFGISACASFIFLLVLTTEAALPVDISIKESLTLPFKQDLEVAAGSYKYQREFTDAAVRHGLPLVFILSVARGESFFKSDAISSAGAVGLMQVMPGTAVRYGYSAEDLSDPVKNIDAGVHYLADLYKMFEDPYFVLAAYFCGENAVEKGAAEVRKDCDDYVRYIHTHFAHVLKTAKAYKKDASMLSNFKLAEFNSLSDAEDFNQFVTGKIPEIEMSIFRTETKDVKGMIEFQYDILVSYSDMKEKIKTCNEIKKKTGFDLCK